MSRFCRILLPRCASLAVTLLLTACSTLPTVGPLPPGIALTALTAGAPGAPFAWSPDSRRIAYVRDGLRLRDLADGRERLLTPEVPTALAWAANDAHLALAVAAAGDTVLKLVPLTGAGVTAETRVPGTVVALYARADGVVAVSGELRQFSFGANLLTRIVRWDGRLAPQVAVLHDVTLKPATVRERGHLLPALQSDLSPWGDALLYTRLHDPPEFPPYLKLVWRHLDSGAERLLGTLPLASAGPRFVGRDERIVVGDGEQTVLSRALWEERTFDVLPVPGRLLAVSAGGRQVFADGQLWQDGALLTTLQRVDGAAFSPAGDRLLLRVAATLYLVSGLAPDPLPPLPDATSPERVLLLRRWLAQGLITPADYQAERGF